MEEVVNAKKEIYHCFLVTYTNFAFAQFFGVKGELKGRMYTISPFHHITIFVFARFINVQSLFYSIIFLFAKVE